MDKIIVKNTPMIADTLLDNLKDSERSLFVQFVDEYEIDLSSTMRWYRNGNYVVVVFRNGFRVKFNDTDVLIPEFADSIDLTITDRCDGMCPFCYQGCTPNGEHADLKCMDKFLDSIHPYTELAIGLNDLTHPDLEDFLVEISKRNIIANGTVSIMHAIREKERLKSLQERKLLHGLGISYNGVPQFDVDFPIGQVIDIIKSFHNTVVHVIAGVIREDTLRALEDHDLDLLILGYKDTGRGSIFPAFYEEKHQNQIDLGFWLQDQLRKETKSFRSIYLDTVGFEMYRKAFFCDEDQIGKHNESPYSIYNVVPYDRLLTPSEYNSYYAGTDGEFTFFVDLVKNVYAKNSVAPHMIPIRSWNTVDMFQSLKK